MMRVVLCGPRYNLECIQPQADSFFILGYALGKANIPVEFPRHTHDTIVHHGRNRVMEQILDSKATVALWLDGDTFWKPQDLEHVITNFAWFDEHPRVPLLFAAYILRDEFCSIWVDECREPYLEHLPNDWGSIRGGGFGFVYMNLDLYRKHWPHGPWFDCEYQGVRRGRMLGLVGEDLWHCDNLKNHNLKRPHLIPPSVFTPIHTTK